MTTLRELEKDVLEELKWQLENEDWYNDDDYDLIHSIADSNTPIYYSDILELAAENTFLALDEPELGPAFDGSPTPVNIIAANIFEHLERVLWENIEEIKEEIESELASMLDDDNQILP